MTTPANSPNFPAPLPAKAPFSAPGGVPGTAGVITPSDSVTFAQTRGLFISVAGTLQVTMGGQKVAFPSLALGFYDLAVTQVWNTNTSASGIIALN